MNNIIDEHVVLRAIEYVLPSLPAIIRDNTWGPTGVFIAVGWKGNFNPVTHAMQELGPESEWAKKWDGKDFRTTALRKLSTSLHGGNSSRDIITNHPWLLEPDDSFYVGAAAEDTGLAVAVSGAWSDTDEAIAWMIWNLIRLGCLRKIDKLQKAGRNYL